MIRFENVTIQYAQKPAVSDLCFTFESGGIYALIGGPNSGKTTLLRLLSREARPDSGRVIFHPALKKEEIGYLPQYIFSFQPAVFEGAEPFAAEESRWEERVGAGGGPFACADETEQQTRLERRARRAALSALMAGGKKLLALDQPMDPDDVKGSLKMEAALKTYCENTGCTIVFSTQSIVQAVRIADQLLVLDAGRIVDSGRPAHLMLNTKSAPARAVFSKWYSEAR